MMQQFNMDIWPHLHMRSGHQEYVADSLAEPEAPQDSLSPDSGGPESDSK